MEATGVEAAGRISPGDTGLWNDDQEAAFTRLVADIHSYCDTPVGIQLAHAGRKASTNVPWVEKGGPLSADQGAWTTSAPSAIPFTEGWHTPVSLDEAGMDRIRTAFVEAAKRADRAASPSWSCTAPTAISSRIPFPHLQPTHRPVRWIAGEPHALPLEVAEAVRAVWPKDKALGMRLNGSDWVEGGVTPEETAEMARRLKALGFDYAHISSGGNVATAKIPGREPGYQVDFAEVVKKVNPDLTVIAVGMIAGAEQAEAVLTEGKADMIAVARAVLDDPRWPHHAAETLDGAKQTPNRPGQCNISAPPAPPGPAGRCVTSSSRPPHDTGCFRDGSRRRHILVEMESEKRRRG